MTIKKGMDALSQELGEYEPEPTMDDLTNWMDDGGCCATDGCWVEPDGKCPHGHDSWLIVMGLI